MLYIIRISNNINFNINKINIRRTHKTKYINKTTTISLNPATTQPTIQKLEASISETVETSEMSIQCEIEGKYLWYLLFLPAKMGSVILTK